MSDSSYHLCLEYMINRNFKSHKTNDSSDIIRHKIKLIDSYQLPQKRKRSRIYPSPKKRSYSWTLILGSTTILSLSIFFLAGHFSGNHTHSIFDKFIWRTI